MIELERRAEKGNERNIGGRLKIQQMTRDGLSNNRPVNEGLGEITDRAEEIE